MRPTRVLIVDDEDKIRELVGAYFKEEGFEVLEAADGEQALAEYSRVEPDLVVLDVMLPGIDGVEVLRRLRKRSDVYVLMLTARAEETDTLIGLAVGADDYVTKPFSPREVVARAKAILRRGRNLADHPEAEEVLRFDGLDVDPARREVICDGRPAELTTLEFDLLKVMASAPGRVFTRRQLIERVWGMDFFGDDRVVDVHVGHLRRALNDEAAAPRFIGTVRGVGYKVVAVPR